MKDEYTIGELNPRKNQYVRKPIKKQCTHPRMLDATIERNPVSPNEGDEIYCGGVIQINVTGLLDWLKDQTFATVQMPVKIWGSHEGKNEEYVQAADLSRPILVAEIAPDYRDFVPDIPEDDWVARGYVCIDGYHRLEKAWRMGIEELPAIILRMEQHIPFAYIGYDRYVEYWNRKLRNREEDATRWKRNNPVAK